MSGAGGGTEDKMHTDPDSVEWRERSSVEDVSCAAEAASTLRDRTLTVSRSRKSVRNALRQALSLEGMVGDGTSWVSSSSSFSSRGDGMLQQFEFAWTVMPFGDSANGGAAAGVWAAWIGVATTNRGLDRGGRPDRVLVQSVWKSVPKRRPEAVSSAYEAGGRTRWTR